MHEAEAAQPTRSEFERDRDRVLYCDAFRRLCLITQVVPAGEGRFFHNRLTHSLKVAQFGRRTAQILRNVIATEGGEPEVVDPDVVETACLIHDIGHPPFGHAGEKALNTLLEGNGGFEGNAQSFRVVTRLALRRKGHVGLNLTRATLNASLKYPWAKRDDKKDGKKWGYYVDDERSFMFARELSRGRPETQALEAQIMDWADDVTYAVHDVQDHYRAGMIPLDQMLRGGPARDRFLATQQDSQQAGEVLDKLNMLDVPELHQPFDGSFAQAAALNWFSSQLINRFILAPSVKTSQRSTTYDELSIAPDVRFEVRTLKALMETFVFEHPGLAAHQHGQIAVINKLFELFSDAARDTATMGIIPRHLRDLFANKQGSEHQKQRLRLVADLIAGLTEHEAFSHFLRLTGAAPGSVMDPIWF